MIVATPRSVEDQFDTCSTNHRQRDNHIVSRFDIRFCSVDHLKFETPGAEQRSHCKVDFTVGETNSQRQMSVSIAFSIGLFGREFCLLHSKTMARALGKWHPILQHAGSNAL